MIKSILLVAGLLASSALGVPIENPVNVIRQASGVVITRCANPRMLALAYDDGPYQYTSELVDILDRGGAKATFFWTGTLYGCIYNQASAVRKAYASGHQIASHTWSHPQNFGSLSASGIQSEIQRLEQALVNLIGVRPAYVRPPYLATGGNVLPTLGQMGYKVITNDVDSGDWNGLSVSASQQRFQQAGAGGNGHIPLMHETYANTVRQLTPWLINWANSNGLRLVTVAECLGNAGSAYSATNVPGNGQNTC
ncbi:polysaccharide deacetylase [Stachybotrys elegans]|uniref:Polysaccharide deacetylase n=1 Tax=Stachybotrys elegans TaxID=80388 RepID=A0A8K0SMJ2_9HYPO|nr:polysaccharide deacetylase [Stachybotrys elegans]